MRILLVLMNLLFVVCAYLLGENLARVFIWLLILIDLYVLFVARGG